MAKKLKQSLPEEVHGRDAQHHKVHKHLSMSDFHIFARLN